MSPPSRRRGLACARQRALASAFQALVCTLAGCGAKTGLIVPDEPVPRADAAGFDGDTRLDASRPDLDAVASLPDVPRGSTDAPVRFDAADETASAIVEALEGLRWELPCEATLGARTCSTESTRRVATLLRGAPGARYRATLRFRGVVEVKRYDGGTNDGAFFQIGGAPQGDSVNVYGLAISSPPQQYYLNRVATVDAQACFALDYTATVVLDVGATVTLDAASIDGRELRNLDAAGRPIVIPDVTPAPRAFDGQFIQLDVASLERVM